MLYDVMHTQTSPSTFDVIELGFLNTRVGADP